MNSRKLALSALTRFTLATALVSALPAHAASHAAAAPPAASIAAPIPVPMAAPMTSAEVRKVDKEGKKITLKHGEIKNLDMPPMTMVFRVKDAAMLDKIQPGDKVMVSVEKLDGAFTVTVMEAVK